jgi:hypothetical protein
MEEVKKQEMESLFVPYKIALELKELGFDEPCFGMYYTKDGDVRKCGGNEIGDAPLYQQAFRWFREKYQIDSWIYPNLNGLYSVSNIRRGVGLGLGKVSQYQTYEEAELACLNKLIEIVKNK